jgi:DNA modification methylase
MNQYFKNDFTTLYQGDCEVILDKLETKIDLVITSPPYNIIRPNATDRGYDLYKDGMSNEDYAAWIARIFNMSYGTENTEGMFITINEILTKTNFTLADMIVWKKKTASPNNVSPNKLTRICEYVFVFCRKNEFYTFKTNKKEVGKRETGQSTYQNLFNFIEARNNDASNDLNKATFSSELIHKLLEIYFIDGIVLDNFSGTGTTSYACEQKSIKSISIELSKKQCEYTVKRLSEIQLKFEI